MGLHLIPSGSNLNRQSLLENITGASIEYLIPAPHLRIYREGMPGARPSWLADSQRGPNPATRTCRRHPASGRAREILSRYCPFSTRYPQLVHEHFARFTFFLIHRIDLAWLTRLVASNPLLAGIPRLRQRQMPARKVRKSGKTHWGEEFVWENVQ